MYYSLGITGNKFTVRAHAENKLSIQTLKKKNKSQLRPLPPISNILQHFKTDSFFISIFVLKDDIVDLSQQLVDWMFGFSFSD